MTIHFSGHKYGKTLLNPHIRKNSRLDLKKFSLFGQNLLTLVMCDISISLIQFMVSNWDGFTYLGRSDHLLY